MDEHWPGPDPGDTAAPEESGLAERLMRDEFAEAPAPRARFHRDAKHAATDSTPEHAAAGGGVATVDDTAVHEALVPAVAQTAEVPIVAATAAVATAAADDPVIHEEFAAPAKAQKFRSHRVGMLAGLGVVGALLAVLVLLGPGSGTPKLPSQSVHDVSPISSSGPKTAPATAPTTAPSTTTTTAPASTTTTPPASHGQSQTVSTYITYSLVPGSTVPTSTPAPTTAASTPTTEAPASTTTTTTTAPVSTTPTTHCILGILCN